jgi:hypothetical protein
MSAEQITATATCVVAVATLMGLAIAALGLKTWRVQLEGSAHFDLARRLILEVYRLRDALERVRHPMMLVSEAAGADPNVPWEVSVYERRWQEVLGVRAPLEVCVYEFQILFGDEITELKRELMKQVQTLYLAVSAFAQSKQGRDDRDLGQEYRDVLYGGMGGDDFSVQLQAIVARLEAYARLHLPRKATTRG